MRYEYKPQTGAPCDDCPLHRHCKSNAVACAGFRWWTSKGTRPSPDLVQMVLMPVGERGPLTMKEVKRMRNGMERAV
jgi:hypothetical protein